MPTFTFRFFQDASGNIRVWPPFHFVPKPTLFASRIEFENLSSAVDVAFEDRGAALVGSTPGQDNAHTVSRQTKDGYDLDRSVNVGQAYRFDVTSPPKKTSGDQAGLLAADSPEIIIGG